MARIKDDIRMKDKKVSSLEKKLMKQEKEIGKWQMESDRLRRELDRKDREERGNRRGKGRFNLNKPRNQRGAPGKEQEIFSLHQEIEKRNQYLDKMQVQIENLKGDLQNRELEIETLKHQNYRETSFSVNESKQIHPRYSDTLKPNQNERESSYLQQIEVLKEEIKCMKEFLINIFYVLSSKTEKEFDQALQKESLMSNTFQDLNYDYYRIFMDLISSLKTG